MVSMKLVWGLWLMWGMLARALCFYGFMWESMKFAWIGYCLGNIIVYRSEHYNHNKCL